MEIRAVRQPEVGQENARDFLVGLLAEPEVERVTFVTAWTQPSGVALIKQALDEFRSSGRRATLVTGLSLGVASVEGLEAALAAFDDVLVGFDPTGRTFHTKAFVGYRPDSARCLVGSSNLTRGGLVTNHELGIVVDDVLSSPAIQGVMHHIDGLVSDTNLVKPLDQDLLAALQRSHQVAFTSPSPGGPSRDSTGDAIFLPSPRRLRNDGISPESGSALRLHGTLGSVPEGQPLQPEHVVEARWYKPLPRSDVRRPRPGSSPTNTVTLTQAGHPIDKETWFREVMFRDAAWRPVEGKEELGHERAIIQFTVAGLALDEFTVDLTVEHNPAHASSQSNRVTSIRWEGPMKSLLEHDVDATGMYIVIERFEDQTYRMEFMTDEPYGFTG